jgi:hypothetical protein
MAELAIPLIVLGSMYIVSNKSKKEGLSNNKDSKNKDSKNKGAMASNKEGFYAGDQTTMPLNGVNPPMATKNYPVEQPTAYKNDVNAYRNPKQVTDKYYIPEGFYNDKESHISSVSTNNNVTYSLTGDPIDSTNFKHLNMVPFFGGSIKGMRYDENKNTSDIILDHHQGGGSLQYKKQEQAPLFKPAYDMEYANGMPNASSFLQSRVNPSTSMAMQKPFEQVRVARGLNKGFSSEGSGGFNTSLEARETWLPKTVDELRTKTNPRMVYELKGHEGPADSFIKESSTKDTIGRVEKYKPDTYFESGPERWFTTTGAEKGETLRPIQVLQDVNRPTTSSEYYGPGGNLSANEANYVVGEYEESKRNVLGQSQLTPAYAADKYNATESDFGSKSYNFLQNNRTTTKPQGEYGPVSGVVNAIISPILDSLRPSRKENVIGNIRALGNAGTDVTNGVVYNPADRLRTTIREMTGAKLDNNHLNLERQNEPGHITASFDKLRVQRDTTTVPYSGDAGPATTGAGPLYDAAYNMQHKNTLKSYKNTPNQGGMQIFNERDNITFKRNFSDSYTSPSALRAMGPSTISSALNHGTNRDVQTYDESRIGCERIAPDILSAFKSNPYAQSLSSHA